MINISDLEKILEIVEKHNISHFEFEQEKSKVIIDKENSKKCDLNNEDVYNEQDKKVGVIATDETKDLYKNQIVVSLGSRENLNDIGKNLFKVLRSFDSMDVKIILCEAFEEVGVGTAIMNRLKKSAGFDILEV